MGKCDKQLMFKIAVMGELQANTELFVNACV